MSFHQYQKNQQTLKQLQRLIMSPQMQQAIHLMQVPIMELASIIEQELEQNPVLEYLEEDVEQEEDISKSEDEFFEEEPLEEELFLKENDFEILKRLDEEFRDHFSESENPLFKRSQEEEKLKVFLEQSIPFQESLFEHLQVQTKETFQKEDEQRMAEILIGNFDENGFLAVSLEEIALVNGFSLPDLKRVLVEIQQFDPAGVGAFNLQEALLIQLKRRGLENSLAYRIVEGHYEALLHNRILQIKKALHCTVEEINDAMSQYIARLDFHPGKAFIIERPQPIVPDVSITEEQGKFAVVINDDYLPSLRLNRRYLKMLEDESLSQESKDFIKNKILSAKWLLKNIDQRNETLHGIAQVLVKRQKEYFSTGKGELVPMTMRQIAEELDVHESTIARAVSHKYVETPRGILPLRFFFSNAYTTKGGEDISSKTVREELKKMIEGENKKMPLSDEKLSQLLQRKGIPCARRTVAKYRIEMQIGNASQRKEY